MQKRNNTLRCEKRALARNSVAAFHFILLIMLLMQLHYLNTKGHNIKDTTVTYIFKEILNMIIKNNPYYELNQIVRALEVSLHSKNSQEVQNAQVSFSFACAVAQQRQSDHLPRVTNPHPACLGAPCVCLYVCVWASGACVCELRNRILKTVWDWEIVSQTEYASVCVCIAYVIHDCILWVYDSLCVPFVFLALLEHDWFLVCDVYPSKPIIKNLGFFFCFFFKMLFTFKMRPIMSKVCVRQILSIQGQ